MSMRKMKDSGIEWIGQIPEDWKVVKTKYSYTNKKKVVGEDAENYQRLALTLKGVIQRSKEDSQGLQPEEFKGYQILQENELVFKLIDLENVATSRVGYSKYTGIVSPAYIVLRPKGEDESKYGEYYFLSMWQREIFNHLGDDGVRSSLNASDLLNIPYLKISNEEKQAIASYLDTKCSEIDTIVRETEQTIEEYKKLKQSLITEVVTGKKRVADDGLSLSDEPREMKDSGVEWIGEVPREWEIIRLKGLGNCQNGISKGAEYFGEDFEFPFVNYTDAYNNYEIPDPRGRANSTQEDRIRYSLKEGDVLFTRTSETIEEIGFASTCMKDINNAVFSGFLIRFRPTTNNLFKGFSKYYFRSSHLRRYFVKEMNLVTRASLSQQLLKGMSVALPSIKEQKSIATYLDSKCSEIDRLISDKQRLLEELEIYKKSLIYECVTGKREIN